MRLIIPILFIVISMPFCKKEKPTVTAEVPEEKQATFHVFANQDYSGTGVENTTAELRLQVRLINYRTGAQEIVWDSLFPVRRIVEFPLYNNKIEVVKKYPVLNSYQKLNASMSVIYRDGSLISQQGKSDEAVPGVRSVLLEANL